MDRGAWWATIDGVAKSESRVNDFHFASAYKFKKQSNYIQPCCTPFSNLNQSVVPCPVLTVAYWATDRFLRQ